MLSGCSSNSELARPRLIPDMNTSDSVLDTPSIPDEAANSPKPSSAE